MSDSTPASTRAASDAQATAAPSLPRIPVLPPIVISNQRPHPPSSRGSAGGSRRPAPTARTVLLSTPSLTSHSDISSEEPSPRNRPDYFLSVHDYRSRIRNHNDVVQLCTLAARQHSIDRINWINALEVEIERLRQEVQQKENEIFQRFSELNTPKFRRAVQPLFILHPANNVVAGLPRSSAPFYPLGSRYNPLPVLSSVRNRTPTPLPIRPRTRAPPYTSNPSHRHPCFECGSLDHWALNCPRYRCQICRRSAPGHRVRNCPETDPQEDDSHSHDDGYDDLPDDAIANITGEPYH